MNKNIFLVVATKISFLMFFLVAHAAFSPAPSGLGRIVGIICTVFNWMYTIALAVGIIFVIIGAITYMTSGGDTGKVGEANKKILYAAVGMAIAMIAKGFPMIIAELVGESGDVNACK